MKKDPVVFVTHIIDSIQLIESYMEGRTEADLMESTGLQDKIIRRIQVIGEAVKNLPDDLKKKPPRSSMARHYGNAGYCYPSVLWD